MKHFDDSSKKLIKNVAALLVSALVLIAATVAWFATKVNVTSPTITATIKSQIPFEFSARDESSVFLNVTNNAFTFSSPTTSATDTLLEQVQASGWTQTATWNMQALIPGAYRAYKMVVPVSDKPSLHISNIASSCSGSTDKLNVLKGVYLQAAAFTSTENNGVTTYTQVGTAVCDSLFNLTGSGANNYVDEVFSETEVPSFTVVINIGVPGEGDKTVHDALRALGASLTFGPVSTSTGESSQNVEDVSGS